METNRTEPIRLAGTTDPGAYLSARVEAAEKCIGVENATDLSQGRGWPSEGTTVGASLSAVRRDRGRIIRVEMGVSEHAHRR